MRSLSLPLGVLGELGLSSRFTPPHPPLIRQHRRGSYIRESLPSIYATTPDIPGTLGLLGQVSLSQVQSPIPTYLGVLGWVFQIKLPSNTWHFRTARLDCFLYPTPQDC